jgi:hypothetical protein
MRSHSDVTIGTTAKQVRFASGADYIRIQLHVVDAVTQDVCAALSAHLGDDGLTFPQEVHTVLASV